MLLNEVYEDNLLIRFVLYLDLTHHPLRLQNMQKLMGEVNDEIIYLMLFATPYYFLFCLRHTR